MFPGKPLRIKADSFLRPIRMPDTFTDGSSAKNIAMPNVKDTSQTGPMAIEICSHVQVEKPARKLLSDEQTALDYIAVLIEHGHFSDATRLVAHLLPAREAVWWACQCARQAAEPTPPPEWKTALEAAEKWVTELSEASRWDAQKAAHEAGLNTAAGCAAMAAFATGSMSPPDAPQVPPAPHVTAEVVAGSILVSCLSPNPTEAPPKYRAFLQQGIELFRSTVAQ